MILDEQDVERLVMIGSSAGGYAALAFGALLQADLVLSFSPRRSSTAPGWRRWETCRWPGTSTR